MASGYIPLPAPQIRNAMADFSGINQGIDSLAEKQQQNAMMAYRKDRDKVSDARSNAMMGIQQNQESRAQATFDDKRGEEALNQLAGIYQTIEQAPEAERAALYGRVQPLYSRLRTRIADFDTDLQAMGVDPNDHVAVGKLVMGRARGYVDPTKSQAPSNVQEWQYFSQLPPDKKQEYLTMKRSEKYLDTGTEFTRPNPIAPGQNISTVPKNIAGEERAKVEGKAAGEASVAMPKLEMGFNAFNQKSDRLLSVIDRAMSRIGPNTTGWGGLMSTLPGTEARALSTDLDTIKANVGFEELQAMRDASPTGGALGQVSEQENRLLQSIRGSLDQMNSGQNLAENLGIVRESVAQLKALKAQQWQADRSRAQDFSPAPQAGPQAPAPAQPGGPQPGTVMDGYIFKGGNPADPNSWEKQ